MTPQEQQAFDRMKVALKAIAWSNDSKWQQDCAKESLSAAKAVDQSVDAKKIVQAQGEAVLWQFRNIVGGDPATDWQECKPRNPYINTVQDTVNELLAYRYDGRPCYEVRALYTHPQASEPAWLPIETAPKDGRPVWVRGKNFGEIGRGLHYCWAYFDGVKWYEPGFESSMLQYLTHWMPIPAAPAIGGQQP